MNQHNCLNLWIINTNFDIIELFHKQLNNSPQSEKQSSSKLPDSGGKFEFQLNRQNDRSSND